MAPMNADLAIGGEESRTAIILKSMTQWLTAFAILLLSGFEIWAGHSAISLCIGMLAVGLVLPPIRKQIHRGIRDSLTPSVSACIVIVLLVVQLGFTFHGNVVMEQEQKTAQEQRWRDTIAARHQALADTFTVNKSAIISAIDDQVKGGNFAAALAESNKYDNADPELDNRKLQIKASLAKISLQDERSLTLEQRAAAYTQLAESEPANMQYAETARTLSAQLVTERNDAVDKVIKHAQLLTQFSQYDGSHRNVEAAIKARMNNPDSYKHVETRFVETPSGAIVYSEFHGTNAFGGVITTTAVANVDRAGNVTSLAF
jgi:hypothetical protein